MNYKERLNKIEEYVWSIRPVPSYEGVNNGEMMWEVYDDSDDNHWHKGFGRNILEAVEDSLKSDDDPTKSTYVSFDTDKYYQ